VGQVIKDSPGAELLSLLSHCPVRIPLHILSSLHVNLLISPELFVNLINVLLYAKLINEVKETVVPEAE
jgi:hypothetical protein